MREVIVRAWCDACWADGEVRTEAAQSWVIGVVASENARPTLHKVETCEMHSKTYVDLLAFLNTTELLGALPPKPGRPPARSSVTPPREAIGPGRPGSGPNGEYLNPRTVCPVCHNEMATTSLTLHVWKAHTDKGGRVEQPTHCPDCGAYFDNGQAMGQHRRRLHAYDSLTEALSFVPGYQS